MAEQLWIDADFARDWQCEDPFAATAVMRGEIYRQKEGRTTLSFRLRERGYFLKVHRGIGWAEIFKNLLQGRAPVLGAANELHAARRLTQLGVDTLTPVAFGARGLNPAKRYSFLITQELTGTVDLEALCARWPGEAPSRALKLLLLHRVADVSRRMHQAGINHRDYYLCHFLLDPDSVNENCDDSVLRCYLIDLHRAQMRRSTPMRWRVKDLAGLLFSAMDIGLSRRDLLRFIEIYSASPWRQSLQRDQVMWRQVMARAIKLYRSDHGREPPRLFIEMAAH